LDDLLFPACIKKDRDDGDGTSLTCPHGKKGWPKMETSRYEVSFTPIEVVEILEK
jgi:hypothetical protein